MRRILFVFFVASIFVFGSSSIALAGMYTDTEGHWAESAIDAWSDLQVIQGSDGLFRPDDGIIRGEMALILDRIFQYSLTEEDALTEDVPSIENRFSDLLPDMWYTEAVLYVNEAGIILGYEDKVRPEDGITRQEAVVMIARALGLDQTMPDFTLAYGDTALIADWARPAVTTLTALGYITDSPTNFRPEDPITRAEVVVILDNIIDHLWRNSGLYNRYIAGNAVVAGPRTLLINSHITGDLFIAGGESKEVILENTIVDGNIINVANATVTNGVEDTVFFGSKEIPLLYDVVTNRYAAADFVTENGRVQYLAADSEMGIDVSEWQKDIDWEAVASDGIDFAVIRVGYRGYTEGKLNLDSKYYENMTEAQAAGLKLGVYFYSQAISVEEAIEEAEFVLSNLHGYDLTYPIVFDWETAGTADARTNGLDNTVLTDCAIAFCETIAAAGYEPVIYLYGNLAYTRYQLDRLTAYDWWFAGYSETPEFYYNFRIWQYTSSGSVAGIEGRTDMNLCFNPY